LSSEPGAAQFDFAPQGVACTLEVPIMAAGGSQTA
jgi:hypothetical protein